MNTVGSSQRRSFGAKATARLVVRWLGFPLLAATHAQALTPPLYTTPKTVIQCPGGKGIRQVWKRDELLDSARCSGRPACWVEYWQRDPLLTPPFVVISRCAGGTIFWAKSAPVVGEIPKRRIDAPELAPKVWRTAIELAPLYESEYLEAISQGLGDSPERLAYLRLEAWREANNEIWRSGLLKEQGAPAFFPPGSLRRMNLEALMLMLDDGDPEQLLVKIEGLRHLARFDEAAKLLKSESLSAENLQSRVAKIRERVRLRDARSAAEIGELIGVQ